MKSLILNLFKRLSFFRSDVFRIILTYVIGIVALFLILVFTNSFFQNFNTQTHLLAFMGITLLLGILNIFLLRRIIFHGLKDWMKVMMTFGGNLCGALFLLYMSSVGNDENFFVLFFPALMLFSLPFLFWTTVRAILAIPALAYLPLQITNLKDIVAEINWAEDESKGFVWEFENTEEMGDNGRYWVRTHAAYSVEKMKLKDLFKGLLSLHNHNLSPGNPIHFECGANYHGWRFYVEKKSLFSTTRRPLNPELSLRENRIRFHLLSKNEREEMNNLRKDLTKKFKTTTINIERISAEKPLVNTNGNSTFFTTA